MYLEQAFVNISVPGSKLKKPGMGPHFAKASAGYNKIALSAKACGVHERAIGACLASRKWKHMESWPGSFGIIIFFWSMD